MLEKDVMNGTFYCSLSKNQHNDNKWIRSTGYLQKSRKFPYINLENLQDWRKKGCEELLR